MHFCPLIKDRCQEGCEWWVTEWQACAIWVLAAALGLEKAGK